MPPSTPSSIPPDWFLRSRLKLRHIQLIVAIDENRSIHRAAGQINMTQPAATKLLSTLEDLLGIRLFERSTRGMFPTAYGEALVRHSRTILGTLNIAQEELQAISRGATGRIKIGALLFLVPVLLPRALVLFKQQNPTINVYVQEGTLKSLLPHLRNGYLDAVVGRLTPEVDSEGLHFEQCAQGEAGMAVVVRSGHPLAGRDNLRLADLADQSWILPTPEAHYRHRIDAAFRGEGVLPPANVIESMSILHNTSLLQASDMLGVMPVDVAKHYQDLGWLDELSVPLPLPYGPIGIISRSETVPSAALEELYDALKQVSARLVDRHISSRPDVD